MVRKTVTVSVCRRPEYTRRTLEALMACEGIGEYMVGIVVDPQCDETMRVVNEFLLRRPWEKWVMGNPSNCNATIRASLHVGFDMWKSEYHIHLEDDTVPAPDCLRWFEWAAQFGDNKNFFTASAYSRDKDGDADEGRARLWFTPWGWATWRDRFEEFAHKFVGPPELSWDVSVNHVFRGYRWEIYPALARTTNIGAELGEHATPELWDIEQRNDRWAGATGDRCSQWRAGWIPRT